MPTKINEARAHNRRTFYRVAVIMMLLTSLVACREHTPPSSPAPAHADATVWIEKGKSIQQAVFAVLSENLSTAMAEGGVPAAVPYCRLQALPLTDSLARVHGVTIRRATLQPRNPANQATESETDILAGFRREILAGREPVPVARREGEEIAYYGPIRIQALCLNCHGVSGKELQPENEALIRSLYPEDQATGYALGDLRGVWHIRWKAE